VDTLAKGRNVDHSTIIARVSTIGEYRFLVDTVEVEVVGYAYRQTVESSVYVAPVRTSRG